MIIKETLSLTWRGDMSQNISSSHDTARTHLSEASVRTVLLQEQVQGIEAAISASDVHAANAQQPHAGGELGTHSRVPRGPDDFGPETGRASEEAGFWRRSHLG